MKDEDYIKLLDKAIRYCSYSERCTADINTWLYKARAGEDYREKILQYLIDNKILNDQRYADHFADGKLRFNKWGKIKIRAYLRQKSIPGQVIDQSLNQINPEEYRNILIGILNNKFNQLNDSKAFEKTVRYAQQKGFEIPLILKELNVIVNQQ